MVRRTCTEKNIKGYMMSWKKITILYPPSPIKEIQFNGACKGCGSENFKLFVTSPILQSQRNMHIVDLSNIAYCANCGTPHNSKTHYWYNGYDGRLHETRVSVNDKRDMVPADTTRFEQAITILDSELIGEYNKKNLEQQLEGT